MLDNDATIDALAQAVAWGEDISARQVAAERTKRKALAPAYCVRSTALKGAVRQQLPIRLRRPDPTSEIRADLAKVMRGAEKYRANRARSAVFVLLDQVYEVGRKWKAESRVAEFLSSGAEAPKRRYPHAR